MNVNAKVFGSLGERSWSPEPPQLPFCSAAFRKLR